MIIEKLANVNKSKPQVEERVQQATCACKGSQLLMLFAVLWDLWEVGPTWRKQCSQGQASRFMTEPYFLSAC